MNLFSLSSFQIKHNVVKMTRRDPGLLQLKHGALLVLTLILAATAGLFNI